MVVTKKTSSRASKPAAKPQAKSAAAKKTTKSTIKKVAKSGSTASAGASPSTSQVTSRMRVYNLTRDVPDHQFFVLANGQPVKNVAELAALLDQLEDHVFEHHVTADRNDFHNWIKDVFEDVELARKITGIGDKKHMQLVIYRHMAGHE